MPDQRERDPNEIGALWLRDGRKGQFLSGQINGQDVVCFPVNSQNPRAPAWRVMKSEPREERGREERPAASRRLDDRAPRERRQSRVDDFEGDGFEDSNRRYDQ